MMMRKIQIFGLAFAAVGAFCAMLVTTASAETTLPAQWLNNGIAITTTLETETTGELKLEDTNTIAGPAAILCSFILDGTDGPGGVDLFTKVLNLAKEEVGEELVGLGLLCSAVLACETATEASPLEVWPALLPWPTLLFLMENGEILDLVEFAHYDLLCLVVGVMVEDLCESADSEFKVENDANGDAEVPSGQVGLPLGTCTLGGAGSAVNETTELSPITLVGAGNLLSVSSE